MIQNLFQIYPELQNVRFRILTEETTTLESKTIYQINTSRQGYGKRLGYEVDKPKIESILKKFKNHEQVPFITTLDYESDNTINIPPGFLCCQRIKKEANYYIQYNKNIEYYGNLFWRGDKTTHKVREIVENFKKCINFDIGHWTPASGRFYADNACTQHEYDIYFNRLKQSDAFLVMRGDRPWTNSFFDCLRANTIPVCIDTFYHKLGWHKIGFDINDMFLNFDSKKDGLEKIENEIQNLLKDKERVLSIKNNLLKFFTQVIMKDEYLLTQGASEFGTGWGNTIKSKLLEIHNNNYTLKENYLF